MEALVKEGVEQIIVVKHTTTPERERLLEVARATGAGVMLWDCAFSPILERQGDGGEA